MVKGDPVLASLAQVMLHLRTSGSGKDSAYVLSRLRKQQERKTSTAFNTLCDMC